MQLSPPAPESARPAKILYHHRTRLRPTGTACLVAPEGSEGLAGSRQVVTPLPVGTVLAFSPVPAHRSGSMPSTPGRLHPDLRIHCYGSEAGTRRGPRRCWTTAYVNDSLT
jgi:hypothetical protein